MYTSERILGALVQILKSKSLMSLYKRKISELLVGQYIIKQNISKINILLEKKQVSYVTYLITGVGTRRGWGAIFKNKLNF